MRRSGCEVRKFASGASGSRRSVAGECVPVFEAGELCFRTIGGLDEVQGARGDEHGQLADVGGFQEAEAELLGRRVHRAALLDHFLERAAASRAASTDAIALSSIAAAARAIRLVRGPTATSVTSPALRSSLSQRAIAPSWLA